MDDIWYIWLDLRVDIYMLFVIVIFFLMNGTIRSHRKILEEHIKRIKALEERRMV